MDTKRVRHTGNDFYMVRYFISKYNCWFSYKTYTTKQAALTAIKNLKSKYGNNSKTKFQIVWKPYAFCDKDREIIVYQEEDVNE